MPVRLLITDVTEMRAGNYCVAGWDPTGGRMIRPLPDGGNWTSGLLSAHGLQPGVVIQVQPAEASSHGVFPHRTEDMIVDKGGIHRVVAAVPNWFGANAPPCSLAIAAGYGHNIQTTGEWNGVLKGAYVAEGTQTGSLIGLRLSSQSLEFVTSDFDASKLRAIITDDDASYNLPVVSHDLLHIFRIGGVTAVEAHIQAATEVHVRVGLARAWSGQPGKCFAMLNGVLW